MKTPKIQSLLNLPLWQMPKQLLVRLKELISRLLGKSKSSPSLNKEPKLQVKQGKPKLQRGRKKKSEVSIEEIKQQLKPKKRGRPRKDDTKKVSKKS